MKKNKKCVNEYFHDYVFLTARGNGKTIESVNQRLEKYDEYAAQLGYYNLVSKYMKLNADNKSLRGTCKALGEKNNNQRKELINLMRVIRNLKNESNVDNEIIKEMSETIDELKAEVQEANDNATWWENRYRALYKLNQMNKKGN